MANTRGPNNILFEDQNNLLTRPNSLTPAPISRTKTYIGNSAHGRSNNACDSLTLDPILQSIAQQPWVNSINVFTRSFYVAEPKSARIFLSWLSFCAFGICAHKMLVKLTPSCIWHSQPSHISTFKNSTFPNLKFTYFDLVGVLAEMLNETVIHWVSKTNVYEDGYKNKRN